MAIFKTSIRHYKMSFGGPKRSAVWQYFTQLAINEARCTLCNSVYIYAKGSTSNLHKHLQTKHGIVKGKKIKREPTETDNSDSESLADVRRSLTRKRRNSDDIDIEESNLELLADNKINESTSRKRYSSAWDYFVKVSDGEARCNICHTIYSFQRGGGTSNLMRHLRTKHKLTRLSQSCQSSVTDTNLDESEDIDPLVDTKPVLQHLTTYRPRAKPSKSKPRKSPIWKYFSQVSKEEVTCNTCRSVYSYKGGSTSNLHKHLKLHMSNKDTIVKSGDISSFLSNFDSTVENFEDESEPDESAEAVPNAASTPQAEKIKHPTGSLVTATLPRQKKLNELLLNMIILDLQSFSILHDEGFSGLVRMLDPSYKLPSDDSELTSLLDKRYEQAKKVLMKLLHEATDVTVTADTWISLENDHYLSMSVHFITEKWKLLSCFLDCVTYDEHDTGANLSENIHQIAIDWGISDKVHIAVTDNSPIVVNAVQQNNWPHLHCFAHTLNLIVQHGLATFSDIHKKVKSIVEYFQQNPQANSTFLDTQKQLDSESTPKKLKNDDSTLWNTTFHMFERLIKLEEPLTLTAGLLNNPPQLLDEVEIKALKEVHKVLSPFEQITCEMALDSSISVSKIIIIVRGLTSVLSKFSDEVETETAQMLIKDLQQSIGELLPSVEYDSYLAKASLLDPRFSRLAFSMEDALKIAKADLEEEAKVRVEERLKYKDSEIENESASNNLNEKQTIEPESLIWQEFDTSIKSTTQSNPAEVAASEIRLYLEEPIIDRKSDSLSWWKSKADLYPTLSSLARKHLCAVGTSVNCKTIFSEAGRTFSERRSWLEDDYISKILFLHFNEFLSENQK